MRRHWYPSMRILSIALFFLFIFAPAQAEAEILKRVKIEYYTVSGKTVDELRAQMKMYGPEDRYGKHFGYTKTKTSTYFRVVSKAGGCRLRDVRIMLKAKIRLPRLQTRQGIAKSLLIKWDRFSANLERHEWGHVRIGQNIAHRIDRELKELVVPSGCMSMAAEIKNVATRFQTVREQHNISYDDLTFHGALQGAYFH